MLFLFDQLFSIEFVLHVSNNEDVVLDEIYDEERFHKQVYVYVLIEVIDNFLKHDEINH
jgi:hypothetical protein